MPIPNDKPIKKDLFKVWIFFILKKINKIDKCKKSQTDVTGWIVRNKPRVKPLKANFLIRKVPKKKVKRLNDNEPLICSEKYKVG